MSRAGSIRKIIAQHTLNVDNLYFVEADLKDEAIFQTLSDYNRLSIVKAICDKECSVGEIVSSTRLSQPLVSHHLRVLKENDFLVTKRKGPFVLYSLKDGKILYALDLFLEIFKDSEIKVQHPFRFCGEKMMRMYHSK